MKHTCMEPVRRGDRRFGGPLHARADVRVDFRFDCRDRAFAYLVARQPRALHLQGVAADPLALDGGLVAIAPVPVVADPDMLEVAAAFYVEERRAALAAGLVDGEARQGVDALDVAAVVLVGVA